MHPNAIFMRKAVQASTLTVSVGTLKKCRSKRGASYCVTVSKLFYYVYERSIGNLKKCHCKQSSPYCVTVTGVTVSGEACIVWAWE